MLSFSLFFFFFFFPFINKNLKTEFWLFAELERIELSRKREQAVSSIGLWEQIVQSYKTLLQCSEAQLISWRAELRATEEKEMRLAERFPTPGALTAGANPTCQAADTFSGPNWATAIVAGAEKRLAHLAADGTAARATLFRSIDDEKKVLAEMLGQRSPALINVYIYSLFAKGSLLIYAYDL